MNNVILEGRVVTKPITKIFKNNKLEVKLTLEVGRENDKKQSYDLITITARNKCAKKLLEIGQINDFIKIKGIIQVSINYDSNGFTALNQQIIVREILENYEQTFQSIMDEADSLYNEVDIF